MSIKRAGSWSFVLRLVLVIGVIGLGGIGIPLAERATPKLIVYASVSSFSASPHSLRVILFFTKRALDSIEAIQDAEDLEEAQELADDAQDDLEAALVVLKRLRLRDQDRAQARNYLWLPAQGALYWHGAIVNKRTERPVEATVYLNGQRVAAGVSEVQLLLWGTLKQPIYVRVVAPGFQPWGMRFRFQLTGLKTLEGPIRLLND